MLYLVFEAGGYRLALPAKRIVEVVPRATLRKVPGGPEALAGLLDEGGRLVPVVDLDRLFGGAAVEERLGARIIVVEKGHGEGRFGMIATRVDRLREHPGGSAGAIASGRFGSLLQWDDDLAMVLDLEQIAEEGVGAGIFAGLSERSP